MSYIINITRNGTSGRLRYNHGGVSVNTTCWWDPDVVVDAGTYQGYATRMPSKADGRKGKKREGIWFGKGVPGQRRSQKAQRDLHSQGNQRELVRRLRGDSQRSRGANLGQYRSQGNAQYRDPNLRPGQEGQESVRPTLHKTISTQRIRASLDRGCFSSGLPRPRPRAFPRSN